MSNTLLSPSVTGGEQLQEQELSNHGGVFTSDGSDTEHEHTESNVAASKENDLERQPTEPKIQQQQQDGGAVTRQETNSAPYSIFSDKEKFAMVLTVSFVALLSPLSGQIYLPALPSISKDLDISPSLVNLTITTYMIFQAIAPSFIGNFSDIYGRRPAYLICCIIYLAANIALALQDNYVALIVLRCFQSLGSSATIALSNATSADLVTRAQRGRFISYASIGTTLGPALGPVIGGLITEKFGWRAIFWFLTILAGVVFTVLFVFLPETCRTIVGNGSVPPPKWNLSVMGYLKLRHVQKEGIDADKDTIRAVRRRPNPLASLKILAEKDGGIALGYSSLLVGGYFAILTTLSAQLTDRFGFDSVIVGLCYLPIGVGSICSRWINGFLLDWNFRRTAKKMGVSVDDKNYKNSGAEEKLPFHRIRLQVYIPEVYLSCAIMIGYGWAMQLEAPLAVIEIILFLGGICFSGGVVCISVLILDIHPESAATAAAAGNLSRCLLGAAVTAFATPMINAINIGWTCVFFAGIWIIFSPILWVIMLKGQKWHQEAREKKRAHEQAKAEKTHDLEANRKE